MAGEFKVNGVSFATESSGTITVNNTTLGSSVVVPSSIGGVPFGAIMPFSSITIPTGWLACNGAEYSRSTYASLFSFVSFTDATCDTNSNTSVTMDSTALVGAGFGVSGTGIAAGTTVASVTNGTTLVLSQAATATASNVTLTFMRWGVGTTDANFRVPNFQGAFLRGTGTGTINTRNKAGGLVGVFQEDEFQGHYHEFKASHNVNYGNTHGYLTVPRHSVSNTNFDSQATWPEANNQSSALVRNPVADLTNGTPRTSTETSPYNASVQYCIKF
jgi:microcystin-dependent protein